MKKDMRSQFRERWATLCQDLRNSGFGEDDIAELVLTEVVTMTLDDRSGMTNFVVNVRGKTTAASVH